MRKNNRNTILAVALALVLSFACLTGCGQLAASTTSAITSGGVLFLKVNPEIAVAYDANGKVTSVEARNDDGSKILETYKGFEGKEARAVIAELVTEIGEAGYFVEEIDGKSRQITIEIESGSKLPNDKFLDEVVKEVRDSVKSNDWHSPINLEGESDYGMSDYDDTDYGPNNDGDTDYDDADDDKDDKKDGETDYDDDKDDKKDGETDYDDDKDDKKDGETDYDDDMDDKKDGETDYDDDKDDKKDGETDYEDDKDDKKDGETDYDDDQDDKKNGVTDYDDDIDPKKVGTKDDGSSDYDDQNSSEDTDSGDSDYGN